MIDIWPWKGCDVDIMKTLQLITNGSLECNYFYISLKLNLSDTIYISNYTNLTYVYSLKHDNILNKSSKQSCHNKIKPERGPSPFLCTRYSLVLKAFVIPTFHISDMCLL